MRRCPSDFPLLLLLLAAAMASTAALLLLSAILSLSSSAADPLLRRACNATRFPTECNSAMAAPGLLPRDPSPLQILQAAISLSGRHVTEARYKGQKILDAAKWSVNLTSASQNCLEVLGNSDHRIAAAAAAVDGGRLKDARAWLSGSLHYQYACWSALSYTNHTFLVRETMTFLTFVIRHGSNTLSFAVSLDLFGSDLASWAPPETERAGFWPAVSAPPGPTSTGLHVPDLSRLIPNVTVCHEGDGCLASVQNAVDSAPNNGMTPFVISIKAGVYEETVRVPFEKRHVVFLGDGIGLTIITGSLNVCIPGISTYNSATVGVSGDGFMAKGVTFRNTAGPGAHQAVAFRSDSDLSFIQDCEFVGNQDTLYAQTLRQYYHRCKVKGNVDFIFGNAAAVFEDCEILIVPRMQRPEKGESNAVTAQGRVDPAQSTGFVFKGCVINGTKEYMEMFKSNPSVHQNYLGRPWKEYSRAVFLNCTLGELISAEGWMPWNGGFALGTLYYGEFGNTGPGSNRSGRVAWSSEVPAEHVGVYSAENFIQGLEWIPGLGLERGSLMY